MNNNKLDENLCDFLNYIWNEAVGSIDETFNFNNQNNNESSKFSTFALEKVKNKFISCEDYIDDFLFLI